MSILNEQQRKEYFAWQILKFHSIFLKSIKCFSNNFRAKKVVSLPN